MADAINDIEVEKIRGPGDFCNVKLGSFREDQVCCILVLVLPLSGTNLFDFWKDNIFFYLHNLPYQEAFRIAVEKDQQMLMTLR